MLLYDYHYLGREVVDNDKVLKHSEVDQCC